MAPAAILELLCMGIQEKQNGMSNYEITSTNVTIMRYWWIFEEECSSPEASQSQKMLCNSSCLYKMLVHV